ncbi:ATP:guanido phosphotransferase [Alkaliphilus metalliredigens QYMF]|uniref:Protein-arginine kinase n=1 Tax=Alkaliphilus metalliredigens (strain QYMF) TaxID=293826 RepID=A6TWL7_ALKMQ|nr:protein arginine kinase [Alkaliphilus metalliredigens]ABR50585.1 ATP:guanido phosphotransferase [Alkaliphilus metalliredigens QYMF]
MTKWIKDTGPESDIVVSSRIRIARNIKGIPFPHRLSEDGADSVNQQVYKALMEGDHTLKNQLMLLKMNDMDQVERLNYVEKHLISPHLARSFQGGSVFINQEETISIMMNEEDHIRIQCLLPGLQLETLWELGDEIDNLLEEKIEFAFNEDLGYLTSCPTNLGTGIRASVMMHLPALTLSRSIQRVLQAASQIGLAIRGIYGEGSEFAGNLYQISNQVTLGRTEEEIVQHLKDVVMQIIHKERMTRENLLSGNKVAVEDRVFRSLGIMKNARILSSSEAMQLISDVKLGINLKLVEDIKLEQLNQLMMMIQPGYLQKHFQESLTEEARDIKRAQITRESLA